MAYDQLKDKIPPHNEDAEKATLGAMMLDSQAIAAAAVTLIQDDFYSIANGKVFKAILDLNNDGGQKPDILTVCSKLEQMGELESAGGKAYVSSLTNDVPSSANIEYYAKVVQDCAFRREIIRVSAQMTAKSYDISEEAYQLIEHTQKLIFALTARNSKITSVTTHETVPIAMEKLQKLARNNTAFTGVASGFSGLDKMTAGFQPSDMIVIGARPSVGKTAIALNMATHIAVKEKKPVAFFTLEMSSEAITQRLLSTESMVRHDSVRTGFLSSADKAKLVNAAGVLYDAPISIVDVPNMKLLELRTEARKLRSQNNVEIIFIDYLGLISTDERYNNIYEQVSYISRSIKGLARELEIPIVILAQVGRSAQNERPNLASLRDSGAIEQDADVVMFLHRENKKKSDDYKTENDQNEMQDIELIVAKQRNGATGEIKLGYRANTLKFIERVDNYT
ncbi:MAG: replicative DNA helicase [Termitinemataceae bacterium]|nr:MAG: replicative DNA helicase [Termitinemataceae bacterium]